MAGYVIRVLDGASRDLARLDRPVAGRIVRRLRWLADNLDTIKPVALGADLAGLFKLRVGDYRVIYELLHDERVIVVHAVGHRRDIYRRL